MNKVGGYLKCTVPFLLALLVQIVVTFIGSMVYGIILGFNMAVSGETDPAAIGNEIAAGLSSEVLLTIAAAAAITLAIIFGIWFMKLQKGNDEKHFHAVFQPKNFLLIIVLGLCLQVGVSFLLNLIAYLKPEWFESYQELMEQLVMGNSIISVIYIGLIAPISEELIFRGVILHKSKKIMSLTAANIFQAVLFGIYHMNLVQGVYAFLIGIFFGYVCIKLKSLYGGILLHMAINIGGILLGLIPEESDLSNIILGVVILLSAVGIILITNYFRNMKEENEENASSIGDF